MPATTIRSSHEFPINKVGGDHGEENFPVTAQVRRWLRLWENVVGVVGVERGSHASGEATAATVDALAGFGSQSWLANASGDHLAEGLPVGEGALHFSWAISKHLEFG